MKGKIQNRECEEGRRDSSGKSRAREFNKIGKSNSNDGSLEPRRGSFRRHLREMAPSERDMFSDGSLLRDSRARKTLPLFPRDKRSRYSRSFSKSAVELAHLGLPYITRYLSTLTVRDGRPNWDSRSGSGTERRSGCRSATPPSWIAPAPAPRPRRAESETQDETRLVSWEKRWQTSRELRVHQVTKFGDAQSLAIDQIALIVGFKQAEFVSNGIALNAMWTSDF